MNSDINTSSVWLQGQVPNWFSKHQTLSLSQATSVKQKRKCELRNKISEWKQVINGCRNYNGRDPLFVFPEEIWVKIFDNLTDINDLVKFGNMCPLFNRVWNKAAYMFEKILPSFYHLLPKKSLLNCRQVCKNWLAAVDTVSENYFANCDKNVLPLLPWHKDLARDSSYKFRYEFAIPPRIEEFEYTDDITVTPRFRKIPDLSQFNDKNPLVGNVVTLYKNYGDTFPAMENGLQYLEPFPDSLGRFLHNLGSHVKYLDLKSLNSELFNSVAECYSVCNQILGKCPNLRSLYLTGEIDEDNSKRFSGNLPKHANLQEVALLIKCPEGLFLPVRLDKFVEQYSNQLKSFQVENWNYSSYHTHLWNSLKQLELTVMWRTRDPVLRSLLQMNAPKLELLAIRIDASYYTGLDLESDIAYKNLENLMKICNHFSKLHTVTIDMRNEYEEIRDSDIVRLPKHLICSTTVTTLELTLKNFKISLSFLVCFPLLNRFVLNYMKPEREQFKAIDELYDENKGIVDLAKFLLRDDHPKGIYKSNIWDILPLLNFLDIRKHLGSNILAQTEVYRFTRDGYNAATKPPLET